MAQPQGFRYDKTGQMIPPPKYDREGNPVYEEPVGVLDTALDIGQGFAKGAAETVKVGGELLRKIPGVNALSEALPHTQLDVNLAPANTAESIGFGAEKIAEFMAPGKVPREVAVWMSTRLAPHIASAPRAVRAFLGLVPRMATEAGTAAGITAMQGGDPKTAAVVAGALPVAGRAIEATGPAIRGLAEKQVQRFLQPGTKMTKYESRLISPQILDRRILGTPERVEQLAETNRSAAGTRIKSLEQRLAANLPGDVIDVRPVRSMIMRQVRSYSTRGLGGQQLTVAGRETYQAAAQHYLDFLNQLPDKIPVKQAADLKRQWQDVVRVARGYMEDAPQQASARMAKEAAKAMRRSLLRVNTVGELEGAYKEYQFWATLENILADTALRRTGQQGWGKKILASTLMGATGFAGGGGAMGAAAMGGLALAVQTPTWKLASAQIKNQLADALVAGNYRQVKFLTDRIIKGSVSLATKQSAPAQ